MGIQSAFQNSTDNSLDSDSLLCFDNSLKLTGYCISL